MAAWAESFSPSFVGRGPSSSISPDRYGSKDSFVSFADPYFAANEPVRGRYQGGRERLGRSQSHGSIGSMSRRSKSPSSRQASRPSASNASKRVPSTTASTRASSPSTSKAVSVVPGSEVAKAQRILRRLKSARHLEAIRFEELFQISYKRASQRVAHERKRPGSLKEILKLHSTANAFDVSKDREAIARAQEALEAEMAWATHTLLNPKEDPMELKRIKPEKKEPGRGNSSTRLLVRQKSEYAKQKKMKGGRLDLSDVAGLVKQAVSSEMSLKKKKDELALANWRAATSGIQEVAAAGTSDAEAERAATTTRVKRQSLVTADFKASEEEEFGSQMLSQYELQEVLRPPDLEAILARYKVGKTGGFPPSEQERVNQSFTDFKHAGGNEIEIEDLEKILVHLGYLKIVPEVITSITKRITKFTTLDFDEFNMFMTEYAKYEEEEVRHIFQEFDADGSGSLEVNEVEDVMYSIGITPFKSDVAEVIALVDQDGSGSVNFEEFLNLLSVYRMTEGFSRLEVLKLYRVFARYADALEGESKLREIKPVMLREALMSMFGPQATSLAAKLANEVMNKLEGKFKEKESKYLTRNLSHVTASPSMKGMKFREFLTWARRLREAEIVEYRSQFEKADPDGSGTLDSDELGIVLKRLGYTPLRSTVQDLLDVYQIDEGRPMYFDDFVDMMENFRRTDGFCRSEVVELRTVFKVFDEKGTGEVGPSQVSDMMRFMGFSASLEQSMCSMKVVDFDNTMSLDFREFLRLMRLHREEELVMMKKVFNKKATHGLLRKELALSCLAYLDERGKHLDEATAAEFLEDSADLIDWEDFVDFCDFCRQLAVTKLRVQAGFSDEEVETFKSAFEKYDSDGSGDISRKELQALLQDLQFAMATAEDRQVFLSILVEARKSARRGGVPEDDCGTDGSTDISFWVFVHLLRAVQTREDEKKVTTLESISFEKEERMELREVYHYWVDFYKAQALMPGKGRKTEDDEDSVASTSESVNLDDDDLAELEEDVEVMEEHNGVLKSKTVHQKQELLPMNTLWKLLRKLGLELTATHREQLKGKCALDAENKLPAERRRYVIDFDGFIRLLCWMLDSNFANLRQTSDFLASMRSKRR